MSTVGNSGESKAVVGYKRYALLLALVGFCGSAGAQVSGGGALPLSTPAELQTRGELLVLLDNVQTQIEELSQGGQPANNERLDELKSQLELLLLQAQLEKLQSENSTLRQLVETASAPQSGAPAASLPLLERRIQQLNQQQENFNRQLRVISGQHAEILGGGSAPEGEAYIVEAGDTLSALAQTYLGSGMRWPELLEANPSVTDPDQLTVGTELIIPSAE